MTDAARFDEAAVVLSFLLTDIVGSTRWWDRHPEEMGVALLRHDTLIEEAVRSHRGTLVQSKGEGDSTFSVFPRASDAVAAAWAAQLALAAEEWALPSPLQVRMAVYTGEAVPRGGNYYGTTVNRTARLRSIADAGDVLVGGTTADLVIDQLRGELVLTDLGLHHLRDLDRPERVFRLERRDAARGGAPARADGDTTPVPLPMRFGRIDDVGLVGRSTELEALRAACAATIDDGAFRAVFVSGESGIGKTRLCGELARAAHADGAIVLAGRCSERARTPFGPFGQALGPLVRHAPGNLVESHVRLHRGALGRIVPELNERVPTVAASEVADADTARHLTFRSVVSFLGAAAADRGLVLILDDLHWADAASLDLLGHLLLTEPPEGVFVVGTYRNTDLASAADLGTLLADAWREPGIERLLLGGLQHADIVELIENASGKPLGSAGETLSTALAIETGGNPFLLTEMLRSLRESGLVEQAADGTWDLPPTDVVAGLHLPDRVHDVVGRRVRRLGEETQRVLSVAAVIGTEFEPSLVGAVAGLDPSRRVRRARTGRRGSDRARPRPGARVRLRPRHHPAHVAPAAPPAPARATARHRRRAARAVPGRPPRRGSPPTTSTPAPPRRPGRRRRRRRPRATRRWRTWRRRTPCAGTGRRSS